MPQQPSPLVSVLTDLGMGKPQAETYLALLELAGRGDTPTGYQVAKFLGKNPTSVYKTLAELERLGAVEVVAGRGRGFRPIAPAALIQHLNRNFQRRARLANRLLSRWRIAPPGGELMKLSGRDQVLERFRGLLRDARRVALLQVDVRLMRALRRELRHALNSGVHLLVMGEGAERQLGRHRRLIIVPQPSQQWLDELMPAPLARGAFDARAMVLGFLPGRHGLHAHGYWSASPLLAYREYLGLAMEMAGAQGRALLDGEVTPETIRRREQELLRAALMPLDWERLWEDLEPVASSESPARFRHFAPSLAHPEPAAGSDVLRDLARRRRRWLEEGDRHAERRDPDNPGHHPGE